MTRNFGNVANDSFINVSVLSSLNLLPVLGVKMVNGFGVVVAVQWNGPFLGISVTSSSNSFVDVIGVTSYRKCKNNYETIAIIS